jgi:hypothetical protein
VERRRKSGLNIFRVIALVLLIHLVVAYAIFSLNSESFLPSAQSPTMEEPNFRGVEEIFEDEETGELIRVREFHVSTQLYQPEESETQPEEPAEAPPEADANAPEPDSFLQTPES